MTQITRDNKVDVLIDYAFGPVILDHCVELRLWAPLTKDDLLITGETHPSAMERSADGWHRCFVAGARPGKRYKFALSNGSEVPDPATRHQPQDVNGSSEFMDLKSLGSTVDDWSVEPLEKSVIYELHIGSSTAQETLRAVIERLAHLAQDTSGNGINYDGDGARAESMSFITRSTGSGAPGLTDIGFLSIRLARLCLLMSVRSRHQPRSGIMLPDNIGEAPWVRISTN